MINDFFSGIRSYFKAFQLLSKLRLWKFILVPGIISLLLGGLIGFSTWMFAGQLGQWIVSWYPFDWGLTAVSGIAFWIGVLLIVVFAIVIYKHLVMIIAAPFMSPLSERIEQHLKGQKSNYAGFSWGRAFKDLTRGIYINFRNLIRELFLITPLLILSFIPFFGFIPALLIFIIQAYYAGFGNMDYTLERHLTGKASIRFVRDHRWLAIGNGTVFLFLLMIGLGFIFAPPLATVAATIETVNRLGDKELAYEDDFV